MSETSEAKTAAAHGFRWWPAPAIVLLGVAVFGLLLLRGEAALDGDATQLVFAALGVMAGTLAALLVWWIGFSRLRIRTKAVGLALFAVCGAAAAGSVRIEQVDGAMRPTKWSFRWQKSAEEKALDAIAAVEQAESAEWTPPVEAAATDWPRFRGPGGDGVVPAGSVRLDWDARPPEALWRQPVGLGWSSFTVVGGRAFTQEQRGDDELVVCYEAETGAQVWAHTTADRFSEPVGGDGPRATPTFDDGVLYAVGATGRLSALDPADGKPLWERDILADAGDGTPLDNNPWAVAASPLVSGGRVYLPAGNEVAGRVLCYDATTGEPVWQGGEDPASYATFVTETFGDVEQLLVFDGAGLNGFDTADGTSLWHVDFSNQPKVNAIVPVVRDGRVFVSSGYGVGSALFDVTYADDGWRAEPVWATSNRFKLKFNDPVVVGGHIYGLDEGILACVDFETGKRQWKKGRFGYGQMLLVEDDKLLVLAEDGVVHLIEATPEKFVELASFPAIEGKTWNHPAVADGLLFVRNSEEAACYDLRPARSADDDTPTGEVASAR